MKPCLSSKSVLSNRSRLHLWRSINPRRRALSPIRKNRQAPLRQRIATYLAARGVEYDDALLGRLLKLRNDLAHAHTVEPDHVALVELETRSLARKILREELSARGLTVPAPPQIR
jgi:hypothetical protein